MPNQVTNYQCPNCSGPLHFDSQSQRLKCDYCGSEFTNEEALAYFKEQNEEAVSVGAENIEENIETLQWSEEEKQHMRAWSCPSCGAQLICDEHTAATSCPYCGNPTIVPAQFSGALKPDFVIPFKLDKKAAIKKLNSFYQGKPLLPSAFSQTNHIEEIKGVYVPFWLYDGTADAHMEFRGTRIHSHTTGKEQVTVTDHYKIIRQGEVAFRYVPADASSKMPDEFMDSIEPFDYREMVPFELSYLPGYLADKYDVTAKQDADRAENRMKNTTSAWIRASVNGFASVTTEREHINFVGEKIHYAFFPVWMLSTRWNGKSYLFAMNGQTGKMVGDLPVDYGKFFLYFIVITVVLMAVLYFVLLGGIF